MRKRSRDDQFDLENPRDNAEHAAVTMLDAKTLLAMITALQERPDVDPKFLADARRAVEVMHTRAEARQKAAPTDENKGLFAQIAALYSQIDRKRSYRP